MKKLTKVLALMGAATGVAYLTKKMLDSSNLNSNEPIGSRNQQNGRINENDHKISKGSNYSQSNYSNARMQKMYKDLGMTDAQRRQYEADYRTVMDTWEKDNPKISMDEKKKVAEHNSALKAVLNEAQYSIYREWEKNNPS